jgi:hypothetical protein
MAYFEATTFQARIIGAVVTEAQNANKTPQLELTLDLQGKLDADGGLIPVPPTRYPPRIFLSLTEKAIGTSDQPGPVGDTLQFLGFDGDFNNAQQFEGWEGPVVNEHQLKNDGSGNTRDSFTIVRPYTPRTTPTADRKLVRSLNSKFGKLFKTSAKSPLTPRPDAEPHQETNHKASVGASEDIPF